MIRRSLAVACLTLSISAVSGSHPYLRFDLDRCVWADGKPIDAAQCDRYRRQEAESVAAAAKQQEATERFIREREERERRRQLESERLEAERQAIYRKTQEADERKRRENEAAIARTAARLDQVEREEAERERKASAAERAARKACGKDYRSPTVGMSLDRARQCLGNLTLKAQLNRNDGIVSTYYGPGIYVHEMEGRVISWSTR